MMIENMDASGLTALDRSAAPREPVRLVIWDLDETFWDGTLSEGGIVWRQDNAELVIALCKRGIVNSICSKNDKARVEAVLDEHGMCPYFVFLSVDWSAKGPRLASLVAAMQLRPETVLFIDDNPLNRAEASHCVAGLQVQSEAVIPTLLGDPGLQGRPDPELVRLAQYRVLESRWTDQARAGSDTTAFLRESGITVSIDFDVSAHLDRAVELINRTNQLNFTKSRLPEEPAAARESLRQLLARHTVTAGILRVRDRYGDYGYCGLYVILSQGFAPIPTLCHFTFSCRILGMGIETWLYQHLKRPQLKVVGEVLTDVIGDTRKVDWIKVELPGVLDEAVSQERKLSYVLLRGGCDMRALGHYFHAVTKTTIEEVVAARDGQLRLSCSSIVAAHAIRGVPETLLRDAQPLGFAPTDFETVIANPPAGSPALWLLNFSLEVPIPVLRHKESGALLPAWFMGIQGPPRLMLRSSPEESGLSAPLVEHLRECFEMVGALPDDVFRSNLGLILQQIPQGTRVFILLANGERHAPDGSVTSMPDMQQRNTLIAETARGVPGVELLKPGDFMSLEERRLLAEPHHYDRVVYFRMFQHMMARLDSGEPGGLGGRLRLPRYCPEPRIKAHKAAKTPDS